MFKSILNQFIFFVHIFYKKSAPLANFKKRIYFYVTSYVIILTK